MAPTVCKWYMVKLCLILIVVRYCDNKVYTRCELARDIVELNFRRTYKVVDAVCLAKKLSNMDTSKVGVKNGKKFYGIYQIPEKWCKVGSRGGGCNVSCEALVNDDIYEDTKCFFKIDSFKSQKLFLQEYPEWVMGACYHRNEHNGATRGDCGVYVDYKKDPRYYVPNKNNCLRNIEL